MIRMILQAGCTALVLFSTVGCERTGESADDTHAAQREKYLLAEEPEGAQGIVSVRDQLRDGESYVLFGRIGGVSDPWSPGKAAFVIADPVAMMGLESDGHDCSSGCAFCKKKEGHASRHLAMVRIVDESGDVVAVDARKLLDLDVDEMVVVRGIVSLDKLGNLIVDADGIHVRR